MSRLPSDGAKKPSLIKKVFVDNRYCWISLLCTVGIMMLVYFCYDLFPFGGKSILRMDMYHQYGPLFAEFYDRVTNLESFIYSWRTGLGGPFLGNFFNYLSSPSAILILLLGHENMPESIAGMILIKAAFAAASFTLYLKKSQKRHDLTTAAFGILYAMCGYFVAYYWNVMWIDSMVYFPMVIFGIENIIRHRNPKCYIAFLALTLVSNYYMGYMTCIFSVLYFLVYFFGVNDFSSLYDDTPFTLDENGEKTYKFSQKLKGNIFLRSGFLFAVSSIAAACLVAVALIPTYFILKSCSATSGTMPELDTYNSYYAIFDFLANHLASVTPTIRSSGDDVLPNVYCGIATLVLVPLYLFTKSVPLKEKVSNVALLGIIYFSFNINILNYVWHGFHYPNDLPYRFSFMYSFILLTLAYKAFTRLNEFTGRQILGAGVGLIGAIILIQKIGSKNVEDITVIISIVFTIVYCLVFYISKDKRYKDTAVAVLLLCCVIGEIACSNTDRYSMDQPKKNFVGDYSDFRAVKSELDKLEGNGNYRMELTYNRARMDPAWFGYNGISTFSSMAYEKMSNVQSDLGLEGNYINSYTYNLQTPVYNMMHSLKYIVDNNDNVDVSADYYTKVAEQGKFTAYENKYSLPIGMAVNGSLKEWYTGFNNPFTVQSDWLEYSAGVSDAFALMDFSNVRYYNMDEITAGFDTGDLYFNKTEPGLGELTFILTVPLEKHCYLYVNSEEFDEITITKDEKSFVQNTEDPYIYDLGIVKPDEEVTVLISIDEESDYGYIDFYPYYVNDYAIDEAYKKLQAQSLNITSFTATDIKGTVNAAENGLFFTSIPYDESWKVIVDGKEIDKKDYVALADAYLCFNIAKGEHTVELQFRQKGLILGAAISGFTALALIFAGIIFSLKRKKKAKPAASAVENPVTEFESVFAPEETVNNVIDDTPVEEVIEEAPVEEVIEETPVEEVIEEAPVEEVIEETPVEEVIEDAPVEEVIEEAPVEEVIEEAPEEEIPEEKTIETDDLFSEFEGDED